MTIRPSGIRRWKGRITEAAAVAGRWITEPPASVVPEQRRRIRMLSIFLLLMTINTVAVMFILRRVGSDAWIVLQATSLMLFIGYLASRTRHYRAALGVAVTVPALPPLAIAVFKPPETNLPAELMWLALPLMVASLMLPLGQIILTICFYASFIIALQAAGWIGFTELAPVVSFLSVVTFFVITISLIRRKDQAAMENKVTELQRVERLLSENNEQLDTILNSVPCGIIVVDEETHTIHDINAYASNLIGIPGEEIIGKECHRFICPTEKGKCPITDLGLSKITAEQVLVNRSGNKIPILKNVARVNIGGGRYLLETFIDITERKKLEETLAREATHRRILIEQSRDGIVILDQNGAVYETNRRFAEMLGYSLEETLKLNVWDWEYQYPAEQVREMIRTVDEAGDHFETRHQRKDGTTYDVEISTNGAMFGSQKLIFCVCRDISERKIAEQKLKEAMAHLEKSSTRLAATNKELEAFSYSVSHDLRSPLRSIDGFSQALLEDYLEKLDKTGQDYLKRLRAASQKMGELIDGILKLSRLSRSEMRHEPLNLSELAGEIAGRLKEAQPGRQVQFIIDKGLSANGDPQLLRVLLENLLGNAWKFTSKQPQARIEFSMERNNGKKAYFIRDNGAGFDMTYADKLFGAFQRLHDATEFPGTGIGLATVQRIINRHGGAIWAEGRVGKGATFHFTLD